LERFFPRHGMKCSNIQELPVIKGVESGCVAVDSLVAAEMEQNDRVDLRGTVLTQISSAAIQTSRISLQQP